MKKIHNKLVRDKIPEIIKQDNGEPKIRIMEPKEFLKELFNKLVEEANEAAETKGDKEELMKEIGDVYEVIDTIIDCFDLDKEEILKIKQECKTRRGGFDKRIFLESVEK